MSVPPPLMTTTPYLSTPPSRGRPRAPSCPCRLQFWLAFERVPQLPAQSLHFRIERNCLRKRWLWPYPGGDRAPRQRQTDMRGKRVNHLVGMGACAFVTEDPEPVVLAEALLEIELVASPPEERG